MAKKIFIKGRVDQKLKRDFLRAWHRLNESETKKGRKAISQASFLEILVAEALTDGKRSSPSKPMTQSGKHSSQKIQSDGHP